MFVKENPDRKAKKTFSGRLLLLCAFNFQTFAIIDFISPTIKDHNIKCLCSKCLREVLLNPGYITNLSSGEDCSKKFAARTVVNKYFNNEQKHTNDSARKELVDFNKRQ